MAPIPLQPTPATPPTETVEERLRRLESTWLAEVGYSSSSTELRNHPALLADGRWTSKLGPMEDIEHALHDLAGMVYGSVALVMKRPRPAAGGDNANEDQGFTGPGA